MDVYLLHGVDNFILCDGLHTDIFLVKLWKT
jgi:hypothetical protein